MDAKLCSCGKCTPPSSGGQEGIGSHAAQERFDLKLNQLKTAVQAIDMAAAFNPDEVGGFIALAREIAIELQDAWRKVLS